MKRIIGSILGVSFQTELLIMTLLGLANSTLDWKPFELVVRLNLIRDLHFSINDVHLSNNFTSWIKKLLSITVVVEFLCSLINPFAHLLKLYPIITWSRSDILLPWLITHALNTILPKMLSVSLAFIFYTENIISTMSLLEFLVVETVNLLVAWYNWYVFFAFYLDLREIDRKRTLRKSRKNILEDGNILPQIYSSIPNLQELFYRSSFHTNKLKSLRSVKSLTSFENTSQEVELDEISSPTMSIEENLSPTEKSMKILRLTNEEVEDVHRRRNILNVPDYDNVISDEDINYKTQYEKSIKIEESNSSMSTSQTKCACSSSEDEEEITILISKKVQTKNSAKSEEININVTQSNVEIQSKKHLNMKSKKLINQSTQATENFREPSIDAFEPYLSTRMTLNNSKCNLNHKDDTLHFLLNKNFELLDKMCRTLHIDNQKFPKNNNQKWLIFRHELECNLGRNVFLKEPNSKVSIIKPKRTKDKRLKDNNSQTDIKSKTKTKNKETILKIPNSEILKRKGNYLQKRMESSTKISKKFCSSKQFINEHKMRNEKVNTRDSIENKIIHLFDFDGISKVIPTSLRLPEGTSNRLYHNFMKNSVDKSVSAKSKYRKSNISVLKPIKPIKWSAEYMENKNVKELRNLHAYNNLTLEQDRREMLQKKKKSKMSSYKNALIESTLCNSDATITNVITKLRYKKNKTDELQNNVNINLDNEQFTEEAKEHMPKQFVKYNEFSDKNRVSDLGTSICKLKHFQNLNEQTNQFPVNNVGSTSGMKITDIQHFDMTSARNVEPYSTLISKETLFSQDEIITVKNREIIDTVTAMSQIHQTNVREVIERIDWSNSSHTFHNSSETRMIKNHFTNTTEEPERRVIADDETVSMLQNAFSFSDENERGFHLGPESNEPYPIFQMVTLTMDEIFKSVGWRNFPRFLPCQFESEIEISATDDNIFCLPEGQSTDSRNFENNDVYVGGPSGLNTDKFDEIEERKDTSSSLLDQLQEVLNSSRETLSAIESSCCSELNNNKLKFVDKLEETFSNSIVEYKTAFNDFYNRVEHIKSDINTLDTYPCIGQASLNQDNFYANDTAYSKNQKCMAIMPTNSQNDLSVTNANDSINIDTNNINSEAENNSDSNLMKYGHSIAILENLETKGNRECHSSFEVKIDKHEVNTGNSISLLGYVKEFEKKEHFLRLVKSDESIFLKSNSENSKTMNQDNFPEHIKEKLNKSLK